MRFKWAATRIAQTRENENQGIVVFGSRALDIDLCAGGRKGPGTALALPGALPYKRRLQAAAVAGGLFLGSMPDVRRPDEPWFGTAPASPDSVVKTGS